MDEELARLRAELESMAASQRDKEEGWGKLKKLLEQRETDLIQSEREKGEIAARYHHDSEMLAQLRETRDREISAAHKDLQLSLEDKEREAGALKRENEDLKRAAAGAEKHLELKAHEKQEQLLRDFRVKEQALQERYSKRELELQASWADLENGLWKRAKDARDKLDAVAAQQFEERARALADRQQEIERYLAEQQKTLEEQFEKRCSEAEARYAANEKRLLDGWHAKEQGFHKKFEEELAREKSAIEASFAAAALENQEIKRSYEARRGELEAEHKHQADLLLEEHARQEAERVRRCDDFLAKKTSELEAVHQEKISALLSEQRRLEAELREKAVARMAELEKEAAAARQAFSQEKQEWIARTQKDAKEEHEALLAQLEQRERVLEEKFRARDEDLTRAHRALEAEFRARKAEFEQRHADRERDLDKQWSAREAELVSRYEARLADQRSLLTKESDDKIEASRSEIEKRLSEAHAAREKQARMHLESLLREAQEAGRFSLECAQNEAAASIKNVRNELQARLDEWRQRAERFSSENADLKKALAESEQLARKALQELHEHERAWESEKLSHEQQLRQREIDREKRYAELERRLQELWTKKEAEAVASRLQALEAQHAHYQEQTAKSEEMHRKAFEDWKRRAEADLVAQKEAWLVAREADLGEKRRLLEEDFKRRADALATESINREEALRKQQLAEITKARGEIDALLRAREEELAKRFTEQEAAHSADWARRRETLEVELLAKAAEERHAVLAQLLRENEGRVDKEIDRRVKERESEILKANERWLGEQKKRLGIDPNPSSGDKPAK